MIKVTDFEMGKKIILDFSGEPNYSFLKVENFKIKETDETEEERGESRREELNLELLLWKMDEREPQECM